MTTAVAYVDLGSFSVVVALVIAFCKMMLVALFFMHVRHSTKLTKLVVVGGLLWLAILLLMTMTDFADAHLARRSRAVITASFEEGTGCGEVSA